MADYWKSTGKKYCDFCKCWTADNKASIDFHERGKNHQANIKKRLVEIKKKSIEKRKQDEASKKMFEEMEKAALAAVQKDINNSDISAGKSDIKSIVAAHSESASSSGSSSTYPWACMTAPQGFKYYYNSLTGESTWQMPEVFKQKSVNDQASPSSTNICCSTSFYFRTKHAEEGSRKEAKHVEVRSSKEKKESSSNQRDPYRKEEVEPEPEEVRNVHPLLGGWSTVRQYEPSSPDSANQESNQDTTTQESLESTSHTEEQVSAEHSESKTTDGEVESKEKTERKTGKKFKERVMKTNIVTSDEPVAFKKSKTKKRHVRKRDDDD